MSLKRTPLSQFGYLPRKIQKTLPAEFPILVTGCVVYVNPATATVDLLTDTGALFQQLPVLSTMGNVIARDQSWLLSLRGTNVVAIKINNVYHILGTLPVPANIKQAEDDTGPFICNGTGGDIDSAYKGVGGVNFNHMKRRDYLDGDKVIATSDNVVLGLFKGGIASLKASPLAQILLFKLKNLVRIVSRNFQVLTDFGMISSGQDSEGRTYLNLVGGASFKEETCPEEEKWSINIQMGYIPPEEDEEEEEEPTKRVKIKVFDPEDDEQKTKSVIVLDKLGNVSISCSGTINMSATGEIKLSSEDKVKLNAEKDVAIDAKENVTIDAAKDVIVNAEGNADVTVQQGASVTAMENVVFSAQKQLLISGEQGVQIASSGGAVTLQGGTMVGVSAPKINLN